MNAPLRIATRKSQLALWQAEHVAALLRERGLRGELLDVDLPGHPGEMLERLRVGPPNVALSATHEM